MKWHGNTLKFSEALGCKKGWRTTLAEKTEKNPIRRLRPQNPGEVDRPDGEWKGGGGIFRETKETQHQCGRRRSNWSLMGWRSPEIWREGGTQERPLGVAEARIRKAQK